MKSVAHVGVVIPAYNASAWLPRALDSVLRSDDASRLEIVVVDDGSRDDTSAIAQSYAARDPRVRPVRKENGGPGSARNRGFAELSPEVDAVLFLDADDELEPDAIRKLRAALEAEPEAVAVYGIPRHIGLNSELILPGRAEAWTFERFAVEPAGLRACRAEEPTTFEVLVVGNCICTPGQVLLRRDVFVELGGFEESLKGPEDWDFWLRASRKGHLRLVSSVVLNYRQHGSAQLSSNDLAMRANEAKLVELQLRNLPPELGRVLERGRRYAHLVRSRRWFEWGAQNIRSGRLLAGAKYLRHAAKEWLVFALPRGIIAEA